MNGDVWKTLDWKNSELQGNYNSETDNIKIRHGKKDGMEKLYQSCENKMKSSLWFSVKTAGVQNTLIYFGKKILKKIRS